MVTAIEIRTNGKGLIEITDQVANVVGDGGLSEGLCTLFLQHTSASLVIQENADPAATEDLHAWMERLVPENNPAFTHTEEGPDDMPSHIKAALTVTSLSIPIVDGALSLGTWQGIFLWEHRASPKRRRIVVHLVP